MKRIQAFISVVITLITIPFALAQNTQTTQQESVSAGDKPSTAEEIPQASQVKAISGLIGSEQSIEGVYTGNCLDHSTSDICWQRISAQAASDLRANLEQQYGDSRSIDLTYVDFEGRQRDQYENKRLTMTADGRFYFDVSAHSDNKTVATVTIHRKEERNVKATPINPDQQHEQPQQPKAKDDPIDITLFYSWDGNDQALNNDLAISSDRWGMGVWANNRIGFLAFQGTDTLGIADARENVINAKAKYQTTGIGLGFRLWDTRGINIENALYYVDAKPFTTQVKPNCATCTAVNFTAEDYLQATVNIKTNSRGVNVGWMFTWKVLEQVQNLDSLSSGFYIEAQF